MDATENPRKGLLLGRGLESNLNGMDKCVLVLKILNFENVESSVESPGDRTIVSYELRHFSSEESR